MRWFTVTAFFLTTTTSFCFLPLTDSKKASSPEHDEANHSALAGSLGVLEPQGLVGTGLLGSTADKNGKEDRNVIKSLENGVTGPGSLSKTTGDGNNIRPAKTKGLGDDEDGETGHMHHKHKHTN